MSQNRERKRKFDIPIWCKANLSIEEAAAYSGIGMAKLYEMTESEDCPFVLWIGSRRMIKRKVFDEYINGGNTKDSQMSYADYLDYWMKEYFEINYKYSTAKRYKETFKVLKEEI